MTRLDERAAGAFGAPTVVLHLHDQLRREAIVKLRQVDVAELNPGLTESGFLRLGDRQFSIVRRTFPPLTALRIAEADAHDADRFFAQSRARSSDVSTKAMAPSDDTAISIT